MTLHNKQLLVLMSLIVLCIACYQVTQHTTYHSTLPAIAALNKFGLNANNGGLTFPMLVPFPAGKRFWDDNTQWREVCRTGPNDCTFHEVDWWIDGLNKQGITKGLYVLTGTGRSPEWVKNLGQGQNQQWRAWVALIAAHFKGSKLHITAWEPYNEFTNPNGGWPGTTKELVRLAEDARCIIAGRGSIHDTGESCTAVLKSVGRIAPIDSDTVMLSPSFYTVHKWEDYFATSGAEDAAEQYAIHCYVQNPQQCTQQIELFRHKHPSEKEILMTEVGWCSPRGAPDCKELSETQKAAFVKYIYTSVPVSGLWWYAYNDRVRFLEQNGQLTSAGKEYLLLQTQNITGETNEQRTQE